VPPPEGGPLRVLTVDDEPQLLKMVGLMLRRHGHTVASAASGEEALTHLEREPFDVVVSDVNMGAGMSGWTLAHHVRARWPQTRFVTATGWGAQIDPERAHSDGVAAVVCKPYSMDELLRALRAT
jgi:CheY-like chemotaxis protein